MGFLQSMRHERKTKPGKENWCFIDTTKVSAKSLVEEDLDWTVEGGPFPFFPGRPGARPAEDDRPGGEAGRGSEDASAGRNGTSVVGCRAGFAPHHEPARPDPGVR